MPALPGPDKRYTTIVYILYMTMDILYNGYLHPTMTNHTILNNPPHTVTLTIFPLVGNSSLEQLAYVY